MSRWDAVAILALAAANVGAFLALGLNGRVDFGFWGLGFGAVDLLIGTGFFLAAAWVPWVVLEDPREARIAMLLIFLAWGSIVLVAA